MACCWAIWEHQNKVVFERLVTNPASIIKRVQDVVAEIEGGSLGRGVEDVQGGLLATIVREDRWAVAPRGSVKARAWKEEWEPCVAEAVVVLEGLEEARRKGHEKVVIESDCTQVIKALNRKKHGRNVFYLVVNDILSLASCFTSISWVYTRRVNNSIAHALAHLFPRVVGKRVWSDVLPPSANTVVLNDRLLI
ncbi:uncharacterized protein LOC141632781 [Silene latifolia]|uniref:uncharacterized protein LOC141632781 n=1 Tax=Silene latifolia TaxID=37657 RepID=UPI003D782343